MTDEGLPAAPAKTPEPTKTEVATAIYTTWRNAHLNGMDPSAFAFIETASPALIADIATYL